MKLYYLTGACSLASHICLHESGLAFEVASVDRKNRKTSDGLDYDQVNSKGYVPSLRLDSGELLTENVAVLQYIADRVPATKLAPAAGTMERYRLIEWLAFINSEMHKSFSPLFNAMAPEDARTFSKANLLRRTDWLEREFGSRAHLLGDAFTVADAYLFTVLGWFGLRGIDLAKWPALKGYHERVAARPHVQAAMKAEGLIK
ncbi:MAG TPA: glutathione transferase GstA [Steroidobacteraceae bacterium]|nr:glutathione transferase GstA [Steroidobacteraceae bacterium]